MHRWFVLPFRSAVLQFPKGFSVFSSSSSSLSFFGCFHFHLNRERYVENFVFSFYFACLLSLAQESNCKVMLYIMLLLLIYFDADACSNKFIRPCECMWDSLSMCVCVGALFTSIHFYLRLLSLRHTCTYFISKIELRIHTIQRVLKWIKCYTFNIACLKHICCGWGLKRGNSLKFAYLCDGKRRTNGINTLLYIYFFAIARRKSIERISLSRLVSYSLTLFTFSIFGRVQKRAIPPQMPLSIITKFFVCACVCAIVLIASAHF